MEKKLLVTMKDIHRFKVLRDVIEKRIKNKEAAQILGISYVHVSRIKKKLLNYGFEGILRKQPAHAPNKKITDNIEKEILNLRKNIYYDFNIIHFKEKLEELHKIKLSYESLRQILIKNGFHIPKKKKKIHRIPRRMPKAGMLVQMDSSFHNWLPHIPEKWWLIAMIDDATNKVPYAKFFPKDTLFANMHVIRKFIEIEGLFMSLYVDKASHFKTTRHGGLHYHVNIEQNETQIERALNELGITLITANSAQAKGRIEVTFRLFQDRLVKEMRLAGIKNYDDANSFLINKFLPYYNSKFSHPAQSVYMPLPNDINLDLIFCIKHDRIVNNDNTFKFNGHVFQIPPSSLKPSFAKSIITVCLLPDNKIIALYKNNIIFQSSLPQYTKETKIEELLNKREYLENIPMKHSKLHIKKIYRPPKNHPWKKSFTSLNKQNNSKKKVLTKIEKDAIKEIEKLFKGVIRYVE